MISFLYFTKVFLKSKFLIFARYTFSVLEGSGWNFRHAYYHELHRRTLFKVGVLVFLYFGIFVTCFSPQENTCLRFGKSVGRRNDTFSCWSQNKMQISAVSTLTYNWAQVHFQRDISAFHVQQAISKFMQKLHLKTGKETGKRWSIVLLINLALVEIPNVARCYFPNQLIVNN